MRPSQKTVLQGGVVALLLALLAVVGFSVRRRVPEPTPPTTAAVTPASPGTPRMGGFVLRKLDAQGQESFSLQAESVEGQEQQEVRLTEVVMTFPYRFEGKTATVRVTSRTGHYSKAGDRALFEKDVTIRTEDGFELKTDSLIYRGDKGLARTDAPLTFSRKDVSGSATGAVYHSETGVVDLLADVMLRVGDEGKPPIEIRSREASYARQEEVARFTGGVKATQGGDSLDAESLQIVFSDETREMVGFSAVNDVVVNVTPGGGLPGLQVASSGQGQRILKGRRLEASFGSGRRIEVVTAGPDAELTVLPGPRDARERKRLTARFITFRFDAEGRLAEVTGQKSAVAIIEPMAPARGDARRLSCGTIAARIEPATGQVLEIDFKSDVVITQGTRRATADSGWYDGAKGLMILHGDPGIADTADGSQLTADEIKIRTRTQNLTGTGAVRHVLGQEGTTQRRDLLHKDGAPTLVTCGRVFYDARSVSTSYEQGAVLRSGKDELRAAHIQVAGDTGRRQMRAQGSVASLYHPKNKPGQRARDPVEVRSQEMTYQETVGQVIYRGDVVMKQGDVFSKSPTATLKLSRDGGTIEEATAGEPVEIQQGSRRATGRQATYTPANETLVLIGDKVVLTDPPREVVGRSVVFHVRDEHVLVDGREEGRTETIIKKEPRQP